ncbi:MAG TPA: citrate/2-methylcitrate synthase [Xanthobacteraceae bacterium]|nr:citrate/2-methylcitrate synthase [Xanthobacteraceae bacterium]
MSDGLAGVIAAETVLSHSDPAAAQLWIRGRPLEEAVHELGYEGTVALLWEGFTDETLSGEDVRTALGAARQAAFAQLDAWLGPAKSRPPVEATRLCLAALPDTAGPAEIAGALAVGVAAILRQSQGKDPVWPDPALTTAADLLRMANDAPASPATVQALDTYLTVAAENGLGASTFAARVVASTRASLANAVLAAYAAFTGPLHGGAPGPVLDMLEEAEASGYLDGWLDMRLISGARLAGFGNRAFPNGDPRAALLGAALRRLGPVSARMRFAALFEARAREALKRHRPGRALNPNLELNAALLLDACGFPRQAFTPVFAVARVAGWLAHAMEQQTSGRLIRPTARYVGPPVG